MPRFFQARRNFGYFSTATPYSFAASSKRSSWKSMLASVKSSTALDAGLRFFSSIAAASSILSAEIRSSTLSMSLRSDSVTRGSISVCAE